jgi:hypothetical protein
VVTLAVLVPLVLVVLVPWVVTLAVLVPLVLVVLAP